MERFRLFAVVATILIITASLTVTTSAQDDDIVDFVLEALNSVAEQSSVQLTTETVIAQEIDMTGMPMEFSIIQSGEGAVIYDDGEVSAVSLLVTQSMDAGGMGALFGDLGLTLEMVYVDGETYTRVSDVTGFYEMMLEEFNADEWVLDESATAALPFDIDTIIAQGGNVAIDTWVEEMVASAEELDGETANDQAMRVFALEGDMDALFDSEALSSVLSNFDMDGLDLSSMGMDMEDLDLGMSDMTATLEMIVWIGEDDGLPYYVETITTFDTVMSMMGQSMDMTMILTQSTVYSDYNEDITIEAPEID